MESKRGRRGSSKKAEMALSSLMVFSCLGASGDFYFIKIVHIRDRLKPELSHTLEGFGFRPGCKPHLAYAEAENRESCRVKK